MSDTAKLYEIKLRLTSPWLGSQRTTNNVRRFRREKDTLLSVDRSQWNWAFKQAAEALHMDGVDINTIHPQSSINPPTLVLYRRNYTHKNKQQHEMFEAMRENTVITLQILVSAPETNTIKQQPDQPQLKEIFAFIGQFLGLSPWGGSYGYGRFEVEQLDLK
jgi:hypothetical protein